MTTLSTREISLLLGCSERTARRIKAEVNAYTKANGRELISSRKCLTWAFCEYYGISSEEIERELEMKKRRRGAV